LVGKSLASEFCGRSASGCIADQGGEVVNLQTGAADQGTVDICLAHKLCSVVDLDRTAILNADLICGVGSVGSPDAVADKGVHGLRLVRRCRQSGADRPDRLVSDHGASDFSGVEPCQAAIELAPDHCLGLARFPFVLGFADADDGNEAGVKGGALTAVTDATKNILVEAATFDPVMVRHTSRLHNISSDSSFRFERGVSPGQVNEAAERLCQLIIDSAGGTLATGVLTGGENLPARAAVTMRTARCRDLLGINIDDGTQVEMLEGLGFEPSLSGGVITATVPWHRGDIHREVDLIEEIMRMHGFAAVPVRETLTIAPAADPPDHRAAEAMIAALVSDGFIETVTHTLISEQDAAAFLPSGCSSRQVHETRAAGEPVLRPSIIPSLLRVRRHNADQGVDDLSLFELGSTFHRAADGTDVESLELGLLMDVRIASDGIRPLRGIVDHVARALAGVDAAVTVEPCADLSWLAPAAAVSINDVCVGHIGRLNEAVAPGDGGWLAGAIRPEAFMQTDLPDREAHRLPEHPAIERDLSLIVPESITWAQLVAIADGLDMPHHEATEFVTVYRGKGIPDGQKSVSMRLRFRAADRTLTHEEVDGPIESLIAAFRAEVGAEIRG